MQHCGVAGACGRSSRLAHEWKPFLAWRRSLGALGGLSLRGHAVSRLAQFLPAQVIERYELPVRLTANQNLMLLDVEPQFKADIITTLGALCHCFWMLPRRKLTAQYVSGCAGAPALLHPLLCTSERPSRLQSLSYQSTGRACPAAGSLARHRTTPAYASSAHWEASLGRISFKSIAPRMLQAWQA